MQEHARDVGTDQFGWVSKREGLYAHIELPIFGQRVLFFNYIIAHLRVQNPT
jgi:hypothetical protein